MYPAVGNSWVQQQSGSATIGANDICRICAVYVTAYDICRICPGHVRGGCAHSPKHLRTTCTPTYAHTTEHTHTHTRVCTDEDIPHMTCAAYVRTRHPAYDMRRTCAHMSHRPNCCRLLGTPPLMVPRQARDAQNCVRKKKLDLGRVISLHKRRARASNAQTPEFL